MTFDGVTYSYYCAICTRELGVDLDVRDGEPPAGCPEHGHEDIAWETWNVETEPSYPHREVDI